MFILIIALRLQIADLRARPNRADYTMYFIVYLFGTFNTVKQMNSETKHWTNSGMGSDRSQFFEYVSNGKQLAIYFDSLL